MRIGFTISTLQWNTIISLISIHLHRIKLFYMNMVLRLYPIIPSLKGCIKKRNNCKILTSKNYSKVDFSFVLVLFHQRADLSLAYKKGNMDVIKVIDFGMAIEISSLLTSFPLYYSFLHNSLLPFPNFCHFSLLSCINFSIRAKQ